MGTSIYLCAVCGKEAHYGFDTSWGLCYEHFEQVRDTVLDEVDR